LILVLLITVRAQAATYWVSPSGNDGNQHCVNSASQPSSANTSRTIAQGVGCLSAGDTLILTNGSYASPGYITWVSGSAGGYTTIRAQNNKGATITGDLYVFGPDHHVIFDGLVVTPGLVDIVDGANHIEFNNGEISGSSISCVYSGRPEATLGTNNANALRGNYIHDCGAAGDDHGICWSSPDGIIEDNEFSQASKPTDSAGYCIQIQYGNATGNIIRNNRVHNCGGIVLSAYADGLGRVAQQSYVYNNLVYDTTGGIAISYAGSNSNNNVVVQNTIYNNGQGILIQSSTGAVIKNNISYNNSGQDFVVSSGPSYTASNNLCTSVGTGCQYGGNPSFISTNSASADFLKIPSNSPAVNQGTDLGFNYSHDIINTARPQPVGGAWDIGAYEYLGTAPPVGTTLVAQYGFNEAAANPQDTSGNGNHVTTVGTGITHTTSGCKYGNCMTFTGAGGLTVNASASLSLSQFTIEAWVKPTITPNDTFVSIVSHGNSGRYWLFSSTMTYLCAGSEPVGGFTSDAGPNYYACDTSQLAQDVWAHIAVTYDGTDVKFYRDGSLVSSAVPSSSVSGAEDSIIIGSSIYNEHFTGLIDDLRIWSGARTAAEIAVDRDTPAGSANYIKVAPATELKIGAATLRKRGN